MTTSRLRRSSPPRSFRLTRYYGLVHQKQHAESDSPADYVLYSKSAVHLGGIEVGLR